MNILTSLSVIVVIVLGLLFSYFLGIDSALKKIQKESSGTLRIDKSDHTESPSLFLELKKDLPSLVDGDIVIFTVSDQSYAMIDKARN